MMTDSDVEALLPIVRYLSTELRTIRLAVVLKGRVVEAPDLGPALAYLVAGAAGSLERIRQLEGKPAISEASDAQIARMFACIAPGTILGRDF